MNTAHKQKQMIAPRQIKAVHAAVNKLGLDDDAYRAMLQGRYGVTTCKGLTWRQAEELLDSLNAGTRSEERGTRKTSNLEPRTSNLSFTDFDGRPGMASGAQCRKIAAMWGEVSRMPTAEERERALGHFLKRIVGVDGMRFLTGWQVQKVIKAIETMKKEVTPC